MGGQLLAAALLDDDRIYLSDWDGRIRLLNIKTGTVTTVLEGLTLPRGLTVLDGRLYVSEMGNVCQLHEELAGEPVPGCRRWPSDMETEFFSRASAQILSFGIQNSGGLSDRQIVADKIIAWDSAHAPNGLTNDGTYVYISIGHPMHWKGQGYILTHAEELAAHQRRTDLMGTVARFRPPSNEVEVYATGIRNTYGISIAPDGTIYGADNDVDGGLATEGHLEELNAIKQGGFYGYPFWGTNEAPPEENVIEPVAVLQGTSSTYAYANQQGVYVAYSAIGSKEDGPVIDRFDYETWTPERIFRAEGIITSILEQDGLLYVVTLSGNVHVINPDVAPIRFSPFHNDSYVEEIIAAGGPSMIPPGYDVYLDENRLIYVKSPCTQADVDIWFFLYAIPVNPNDLPEDMKQRGFHNLDFPFDRYGWRSGDTCLAVRELPEYAISIIGTGQTIFEETGYRHTWEVEYSFEP